MQRYRDWLSGLSWPQMYITVSAEFAGGFWLLTLLSGHLFNPIPCVIGGLLFGAAMTPIFRRSLAQSGGRQLQSELVAAIRSGELPGLIDPDTWLPQLERRLAAAEKTNVVYAVVFGLIGIGCVLLGITFPVLDIAVFFASVMLLGISVWSIVRWRVDPQRIRVLLAKIRDTYGISAD